VPREAAGWRAWPAQRRREEGRWTPAFEGQRPPFEPKHGAHADVRLGPRVVELVEQIVELVPVYPPADEIAVRLLCLALARLEAAEDALAKAAPGDLDRLAATSRARLELDLTRTKAKRCARTSRRATETWSQLDRGESRRRSAMHRPGRAAA
jgi:hypothetical protein